MNRRRAIWLVLPLLVVLGVILGIPGWWCRSIADSRMQANAYDAAEDWLQWAEQFGGKDPQNSLVSLRIALARNRPSVAKAALEEAVARNVSADVASDYRLLIEAYRGKKAAVEALTATVSHVPARDVLRASARCALFHSRHNWGLSIVAQWREAFPADGAAAYHAGRFYELQNDRRLALSAYREALDKSPLLASAAFRLGLLLREQNDLDDAIAVFDRCRETRLGPIADLEAAVCLWQLEEEGAAWERLEPVLEIGTKKLQLLYLEADEFTENDRAALLAARIGKKQEAWESVAAYAERAITFNRRNREARGLLAISLQRLGRHEEAALQREQQRELLEASGRARELQVQLETDPGNVPLKLELAEAYIEGVSIEDAEVLLREVVAAHPLRPRPHELLAQIYLEKATKESAYRAMALRHRRLAETLRKNGDPSSTDASFDEPVTTNQPAACL